jgi:hypothetical protein
MCETTTSKVAPSACGGSPLREVVLEEADVGGRRRRYVEKYPASVYAGDDCSRVVHQLGEPPVTTTNIEHAPVAKVAEVAPQERAEALVDQVTVDTNLARVLRGDGIAQPDIVLVSVGHTSEPRSVGKLTPFA